MEAAMSSWDEQKNKAILYGALAIATVGATGYYACMDNNYAYLIIFC